MAFYGPLEALEMFGARPELIAADTRIMAEFEKRTGKRTYIPTDGGVRANARQAELDRVSEGRYPVAAAGTSHHEFGAARDRLIVSADNPTESDYRILAEISAKHGLMNRNGKPEYDPTDKGHRQLNEPLALVRVRWDQLKKKEWGSQSRSSLWQSFWR